MKKKDEKPEAFTDVVKKAIKNIPRGKVATYGQIAAMSGNPRGARQVARILHACSDKDRLPWHRVINGRGMISLEPGRGYELQRELLTREGILFGLNEVIDMERFLWNR